MTRTMFAALLAASLWSCNPVQLKKAETEVAKVMVSDEQEAALGLQVHDELVKQGTRFNTDPRVTGYVQGLVAKLQAEANKERPITWQTFVVDDPKTVNAFATPGGRIYVFTGLLLAAENEAEVAGVMGHEMGHVVARHSARQLVAAKGLETVAAMALGKQPSEVATLAAGLSGQGAMLAYGREMEMEADEHGARFASAAGYDPKALMTFFEKLKAKYGDQPRALVWLSTHPSNTERINHLLQYITSNNLTGSQLAPERLAPIQQALGGAGLKVSRVTE